MTIVYLIFLTYNFQSFALETLKGYYIFHFIFHLGYTFSLICRNIKVPSIIYSTTVKCKHKMYLITLQATRSNYVGSTINADKCTSVIRSKQA